MFTGLVKDIGEIVTIKKNRDGIYLSIKTKLINEIQIDDSISIDGVCQTAVKIDLQQKVFFVQVIQTTLEKTTFSLYKNKQKVNLELALRLSDRLGGHMVSGHVNDTGLVKKIKVIDQSINLEITFPKLLSKYLIAEGSICVNGVSLTIASKTMNTFSIAIIPHTLNETNIHFLKVGDHVNLEVDMIAKYLENLINFKSNNNNSLSIERIRELGF